MVGKGNAAIIFGDLGVPALGNNAAPVQFSNQATKGFQLKVRPEDGADGFGFGLGHDQLLVPGVVAERDGPAGPFAHRRAPPSGRPKRFRRP